ncbi:glycosyltransferase [Dyadobacter tibetensis]|uniref:glycosyltransferase n=1 Tax=Dyadobacter tibetensis TaxID=1211851 RepID=UPI00046F7757|nr:glycosyltransferase [Dyadobacter tibetensis]
MTANKLNGKNIIILGLPRFDSELESTNYTSAKLLARNNRVVYIENPLTIKDYWAIKDTVRHQRRQPFLSIWNTELMGTDTPNLTILVPPVLLSINFLPEGWLYRQLLKLNERILAYKLKRVLRKQRIEAHVFINSFNFHYPGLGSHLNASLAVYHCLDPLIVDFDRRHGLQSEAELVRNSDVVVCSSRQLQRETSELNVNSYFIPNAADLSHSSKCMDPSLLVHSLFKDIKGPVIGYFGAVERRINYELLLAAAQQHQDKSFVLVGPVDPVYIPEFIKLQDNIYLPGPVPYAELPAVLKGFSVAIIPFKKDEVSRTIFPLKLFEYLGAGKAVVCTDFNPDLVDFTADSVHYCSTATQFSAAISAALLEQGPEWVARRQEIAAENTWEKRIDQMSEVMMRSYTRINGTS